MTNGIREVTCDATIGAAIVIKHVDNGMNCRVSKNSAAGTKIPSALICWAKASIAIRTLHDVRTFLNKGYAKDLPKNNIHSLNPLFFVFKYFCPQLPESLELLCIEK